MIIDDDDYHDDDDNNGGEFDEFLFSAKIHDLYGEIVFFFVAEIDSQRNFFLNFFSGNFLYLLSPGKSFSFETIWFCFQPKTVAKMLMISILKKN